jgi:hypothetical protein
MNDKKDDLNKTNYLETRISSYTTEESQENINSLNEEKSKNDTSEIVSINKNLDKSENHNKNQQEENIKRKKFKFFMPSFTE